MGASNIRVFCGAIGKIKQIINVIVKTDYNIALYCLLVKRKGKVNADVVCA